MDTLAPNSLYYSELLQSILGGLIWGHDALFVVITVVGSLLAGDAR